MDIDNLLNKILPEINGQRAWDWVAKISQYNRIQASNGYHEILEVIKKELEQLGFEDIEHFQSPADGTQKTWEYTAPYQWELKSGKFEIIEPEQIKLCDSNEITTSIITHSKSCDITAEIVDIGRGDNEVDYAGEHIDGKIVLMSSLSSMYREFIENSKALGVIYYPDLKRTGEQLDKRIYNSFFTTADRLNIAKFGFSISYNQSMHIKELLREGPVKVHAKIDSEFIEGNLEVLTTVLKGSENSDKEVILIAHLCHPHPGANDNASGAAGLFELARSFHYLVNNHILMPPKYSIRFVWVPEINGTVPWMKSHEKQINQAIACINLDMIGEHRLKIGYPLLTFLAPHSTPSILNDLTSIIVKKVADHPKGVSINGTKVPLSYRLAAFEGGSDHILFSDFYFGIPAIMMGHDDPYYHSSMDTVEYCDPTELKRVIGIALCTSYILSMIDTNVILSLWSIIHQGFLARWSKVTKLLDDISFNLHENKKRGKSEQNSELILLGTEIFNATLEYETNLIKWIKKFSNSKELSEKFDSLEKELSHLIEFRKEVWQNDIQDYSDNKQIEIIGINYNSRFQPAFQGPVLVNTLFNLRKIPLFKDFCESLGYEFLGPINELLNLLCRGFDILRISSYMSLEYGVIILPIQITEMINHFLKIKLIKVL